MPTSDRDKVTDEAVLCDQHGRVLIITLNCPEAMNAINAAISTGLSSAIKRLEEDRG